MGVNEVFIGYPYMLNQNNSNEYNANIWWYVKIIKWLSEVLQEYGIRLNVVNEYGTSRQCSICNANHENGRIKRGLYVCPVTGIKINADLNAARNIAKRAGYETPIPRKILSYIVTSNGVKPLTPKEGVTTETPTVKNPPLKRAGRGSYGVEEHQDYVEAKCPGVVHVSVKHLKVILIRSILNRTPGMVRKTVLYPSSLIALK